MIRDRFIFVGNQGGGTLHTSDGNWGMASPGSAIIHGLDAGPGHVGVTRIRTSNAYGSHLRLFKAPTGWESGGVANQVNYDDVAEFAVHARIPDMTGVCFWFGLADQVALTGGVVNNVGFLYDTANPGLGGQVRCQTVAGGLLTSTLVAAPTANDWHTFELALYPSQVVFWVDGTAVATHTTDIPVGVGLTPYLALFARANAYKYLDLDDFELV